jgi:2-succinyl-5-enolpyruvyl-6-hydroxy-3-cyclohexene-1-carboxylate synthase
MTDVGTANEAAAAALVDELNRSGVRDVCLSPGGRSTPLANALSRNPRLRTWVMTDERSSAFFALGAAIASGAPTAVICTSGTAGANFSPAVVEAFWAEVPLLALTADRPPELRDCGAPQTIRQDSLFSRHVKWSTELGLPDGGESYERYVRATACRAVGIATAEPLGPVHLNVPYREPLTAENVVSLPGAARKDGAPFTSFQPALPVVADACVRAFAEPAEEERGIIVCGPRLAAGTAPAVARLARHLRWPVLADPLSGVRHGHHDRSAVVDAYDMLLRSPEFADAHRPRVVLRFGATPTSKPLNRFLADLDAEQILVTTSSPYPDAAHSLTRVFEGDPEDFCTRVSERAKLRREPGSAWLYSWTKASSTVREVANRLLEAEPGLFQGAVVRRLTGVLPDGALVMVGNSMPVRDMGTFVGGSDRQIRIVANRGANGIDGVLSTALGMAAVRAEPTYLVVGDLSFLHDLGALQIAARHATDLCVVLINNDGGGIFSFLPQAGVGEAFEPFFGTPHGLDVEPAVRMCGGEYTRVRSLDALDAALRSGAGRSGLRVLEVRTRRQQSVMQHRRIVARALEALPGNARRVA